MTFIRRSVLFRPMVFLVTMPFLAGACWAQGVEFLTAPAQPIEGQAWSILVKNRTAGGRDLVASTVPSATVSGQVITLHLNSECSEAFCDVVQMNVFRVEVPPLSAGTYTVNIQEPNFGTRVGVHSIAIAAYPPATPVVRPVEGFWYDPARPGTGLYFQLRGDTVGVAVLDAEIATGTLLRPVWSIDAPTLHRNSIAVAPRSLLAQTVTAGTCLACSPGQEPDLGLAVRGFKVVFESERRAWVTFLDVPSFPIASFPFGTPYVETILTDARDAEFGGPIGLPELRGTWAFDHPSGVVVADFQSAVQTETGNILFAGSPISLVCVSASEQQPSAGCFLEGAATALHGAFVSLGNISETRMRFDSGATSYYATRMFR